MILSTHILSEVQSVCDRVIIINQGVIVADDTERNLSEKLSKDKRYTLRVKAPQTDVLTALSRLERVDSVRPHGQKEEGVYEFLLQPKENQDIREDVFELLRERDWPMLEFKHNAMNLEDIFIRLTDPAVAPVHFQGQPERRGTVRFQGKAQIPSLLRSEGREGGREQMTAIFKREFSAYFKNPIGWVFLAIFWFFCGWGLFILISAGYNMISYVFSNMIIVLLIGIPVLTMRLMSEEIRMKTDQALLTAPVSLSGIVWGKFLAALALFGVGMAMTVVDFIILSSFASPQVSIFVGNLIGLALMGGAFIAIGLFISTMTQSQLAAAILSFAVILFFYMLDGFASYAPWGWAVDLLTSISFFSRYNEFTNGILDYGNIIFFASVIFIFNFLSVRVLERRRWS